MNELKAFDIVVAEEYYCEGFVKYRRAVYDKSEADKVITELKDKCQMHDFFWEGCGFAKRGFKNAIAVSEAFDKLEAEACHHKFKRCLAMASTCRLRARWFCDNAFYKKEQWALQWHKRWLELAEKFKPNKEAK